MNEASHPQAPRTRRDGWTRERQAIFLATLETIGNVRRAAIAVGMNRAGAYRLRKRPDGRALAYAWDLALARRRERLLQERLAKATLQLVRLGHEGKSHSRSRAFSRESGKSDTLRRSEDHRQPRQMCRLSAPSLDALRALLEASRPTRGAAAERLHRPS